MLDKTVPLRIYIVSIILVCIFSAGGVLAWKNRTRGENEKISVGEVALKNEGLLAPTLTAEPQDFSEVEAIFQKISGDEVIFNAKKEAVDTYESEYIDLLKYFPELGKPVYLQVDVYKYMKGAKFNSGYEGFEWVVDLDKWKSWLMSLKIGENKVKVTCSSWGCQEIKDPQIVLVKKINNNKYLVSDGFFKPGGNSTRGYTSFDSKNNLIIDVRLDYYSNGDSIQMLGILSKVENLLP